MYGWGRCTVIIQKWIDEETFLDEQNATNIVLIPKIPKPESVRDL